MDELTVRVGDTERWAVDARLQHAVGEGLLTLPEYEERAGAVWSARTRADLNAVSRDLPAPAPAPVPTPAVPGRTRRSLAVMGGDELRGPVAPGQGVAAYAVMGGSLVPPPREAAGVVAAPGGERVRAHRSSGRRRLAGLLLAAGVLAVAGGAVDDVAVFGSQVVHTDHGRSVGALFGSVTVVVPDGQPVDSRGLVVFGSSACDAACEGPGSQVVRSYGAFGSVEVLTETEYRAEQADDDEEDAPQPADD